MDIQRLNIGVSDQYEAAFKYYQILNVVNSLELTDSEIQLIAFSAIKGNITDKEIREEFCSLYKTTVATINNMVYRMKKKDIFLKEGKKIFVNPQINQLDFSKTFGLVMSIKLNQ